MHNSIWIDDYIFDTVALRDAFETIDIQAIPFDAEYTDAAGYALFDYFCDWSAARDNSITTPSSAILDRLSKTEREAEFTSCCEALAAALQDSYSIQATGNDVARIARLLGADGPDLGQYDFLLDYVWQYSAHLRELNPDQNPAIHDVQKLLHVTRNLPAEFQQAKEQQYSGGSVNQIRARVLKQFHADGEIDVDVLETAKTEIIDEDDGALNSWNNYTIIAQIYYDYFKPRLQIYLRTLADRIKSEFTSLSLTTNLVDFQGARNFVSDFAWMAVYPQANESQKHSYQLYLGIKGDSIKYGLHAGENLREGDWKTNRNLDRIEQSEPIEMADILEKLHAVEPALRRLEGLEPDDVNVDVEKPVRSEEIVRQLEAKKQVVFYGPPGTGKTHLATEFAKWWVAEETASTPEPNQIQSVTFHPAFAYEDFLEGLEADATDNGAVDYEVTDGILKRIARQARQAKDAADGDPPPYVLIIDEINRGNLAQIFGETITLLEADKRDTQTTQLAHSDDEFSIPSNLYVIGTMNTADRSIALVDAALRRRFRFLQFPPDYEALLETHGFEGWRAVDAAIDEATDPFQTLLALSIRGLQHINEQIVDAPDLSKGQQIGHSYLYNVETPQEIVDAWRFDILPLLEEYYFGQFDRIKRQLFSGAGDELIDWNAERIQPFSEPELATFLGQLADTDVTYPETSVSDGGATTTQGQRPTYPEFLTGIHETVFDEVNEVLNAASREATNYNADLDRTTLAIQSQHPDHPAGSDLRYAFQPKTHLDDPRLLVGVYATEDFRTTTEIDFEQVLADSSLSDQFEYADRTYATIEATWPVELDADTPGALDGQALRDAIGEQLLQEIVDEFVRLIKTIHPVAVDATTQE